MVFISNLTFFFLAKQLTGSLSIEKRRNEGQRINAVSHQSGNSFNVGGDLLVGKQTNLSKVKITAEVGDKVLENGGDDERTRLEGTKIADVRIKNGLFRTLD